MRAIGYFSFIFVLFSIYYTLISFLMSQGNYLNLEHLFYTNQLEILFESNNDRLEVFYFTNSLLHLLASIPFGLFDTFVTPVITSILFVSFVVAFILQVFIANKQYAYAVLIGMYFLISPSVLYASVSGSTVYLFYVLFFFMFYFLMRFAFESTSYSLIVVSFILSLFVFLDYTQLYLILFLIPLFFFYSVYTTIGVKRKFINTLNLIFKSSSQQRKLINRFLSIFIIVAFTPVVTFGLFLVINQWFGDGFFYFLSNNASNWNKHNFSEFIFSNLSDQKINESLGVTYYLKSILFISPLFLFSFYLIRKRLMLVYTLLVVLLFLIFNFSISTTIIPNLKYFSILITTALACMTIFISAQNDATKENFKSITILVIVIFLQVGGEFFYFSNSNDFSEVSFKNNILREAHEDELMKPHRELAAYLQANLDHQDTVIVDSSIFYPTLAFTRNELHILDQFNESFYSKMQQPKEGEYLIISNVDTFYNAKDKLRHFQKKDFQNELQFITVYYNSKFTLYKAIKR